MEYVELNCFENFKCINKNCKHSCCIGWQIDIDSHTLKKLKKLSKKDNAVLDKVDFKNKRFIQTKNDTRCAFLNKENLCELIIKYGENFLCQVCCDHPRFKTFYRGRVEQGIGLCCEVGANMLVNFSGKISEITTKKGISKKPTEFEKEKLHFRKTVLDILQNRGIPFSERIERVLDNLSVDKNKFFNYDWESIFSKLEKMNGTRQENTDKIILQNKVVFDLCFEQIAVYFVYRHVCLAQDRLDLKSRTLFAILSTLIISSVFDVNNGNTRSLADICREYSSEIEYSDNNLNTLLDITDNFVL